MGNGHDMAARRKRVRVRFAPSPTGDLHVGNARTALFNWLFARREGGDFILRIEDTDASRTDRVYEANIVEDLRWLGLTWDEGPDVGGDFGPYRQSGRLALYGEHLERLIAKGSVYPCYCSDEELEAERLAQVARREPPRYSGRCRLLSAGERARREGEGRRPAWRFAVPPGTVSFRDVIRGNVTFEGRDLGDFIVVRSNGIPAYNFACVVDDHLMGMTHVIRGEDHLSNTALQLLLYRSFGWQPPRFAHHALILGKDRAKFGKRHGSVSVREFRERGILPEALVNYLALLGASLGGGREVAGIDGILASFSLNRAGKSGAVFDEEKLAWLNAHHLRLLDPEGLRSRLDPFIRKAGYGGEEEGRLQAVIAAVRDNLTDLAQIGDYLVMFDDGRFRLDEEAAAVLGREGSREVVAALGEAVDRHGASFGAVMAYVEEKTSRRGRDLFLPVRAALTGRVRGPELERVFDVLGPESVKKRVAKVLGGVART
ncbi:MAG TPA: glutamate--tRNA ligase [Syntrophales bacterium]|nr:glutamate--tRNA ligase [Syntrophales bacterium]